MNPLAENTRLLAVCLALTATLFFSNCESPLNDIELTDPGVLQPHFVVERTVGDNGAVSQSLTSVIFDKNLASVELKNGKVKVNGKDMSVTELLNVTTYYLPSATVNLNNDYVFEIELPDGKSYGGTVTTQSKAFTSVTVPSNASIDNDLVISWEDVYVHDALVISMNLTSPAGTVPGPTFELTTAQMEAGTFTIPKSNFATPEGITSATITLSGAKYGTIDSKFRNGSTTISRMRIEKKVTFN